MGWRQSAATPLSHFSEETKDRKNLLYAAPRLRKLSIRMVLISITMGFSAVLVCYYTYKFIAKDSKIIHKGVFSLDRFICWLVVGVENQEHQPMNRALQHLKN